MVTLLGIGACIAFTLIFGQDVNWDQRNYHLASVYELLHGRQNRDIIPSNLQSWFNPAIYLPAYGLIMTVRPIVAAILLACLQGLVAPLLYCVFAVVLPVPNLGWRRFHVIASVTVGITGSLYLSEAGTTFADGLLAIPVLGSLWMLLDARSGVPRQALSGLLMGIAFGLKLTSLVFLGGYAVACLVCFGSRRLGVSAWAAVIVGGAIGFAVSGGWWALAMWHAYGNPVFPIANNIFHSPWVDASFRADTRFIPEHWWGVLAYALRMATGHTGVATDRFAGAEVWFRDSRYLVGLCASAGLLLAAFADIVRGRPRHDLLSALAAFYLLSYLTWAFTFGIARYAITLELLGGGMGIALALRLFGRERPIGRWAALALALLLIVTGHPGNWNRTRFAGSWYDFRHLETIRFPDTTYVLTSAEPIGFMLPFLPADARVVRINGTSSVGADQGHSGAPLQAYDTLRVDPHYGFGKREAAIFAQPGISLRTLRALRLPQDEAALVRFGLRVVPGSCRRVESKAGPLESCALVKVAA